MHHKLAFLLIFLFALPAAAQKNEGVNWEEASISEKIKLSISLDEFEDRYKKADSITDSYTYSCAEKTETETKLYHYKGVTFELKNSMLHFRSINFSVRKAMYFAIEGDWFDHTTSLKSFHRSFPEQAHFVEDVYDEVTDEEYQQVIIFPRNLSENYEWENRRENLDSEWGCGRCEHGSPRRRGRISQNSFLAER